MSARGQNYYSVTLIIFFIIFFLTLIGLGYYFFFNLEFLANDKCSFAKAFTCKEAKLQADGVHIELVNMYGMDIKQVSVTLETLNQSSINCKETKTLGDLANSVTTGGMLLCKPAQPYTEGQSIQARFLATFQDPILGFNERGVQGELKLKLLTPQKTWWDKLFS